MSRNRFEGKSVIVTGAASGIGRASSKMFAAEGGSVIVADKSPAVHETAEAILAAGGKAAAIEMNAGSEADVQKLVELAVKTNGGLDVFFANAGISGGTPSFWEQLEPHWREILQVNLIGPIVVNRRTCIGRQLVISNYSRYSAHHALVENPQTQACERSA